MIGLLGKTNLGGSGGGAMRPIRVVGGTVQPAGRENLIWAVTSVNIPSWVISETDPGNPVSGMVWIKDGNVKSCKQYIDGEWKLLESFIYRGGSWVQFSYDRYYLFKSGSGFLVDKVLYSDKNATITYDNFSIIMNATEPVGWIGNIVNLKTEKSEYQTLYFDMEYTKYNGSWPAWAPAVGWDTVPSSSDQYHLTTNCVKFESATFQRKIVSVDISKAPSEFWAQINGAGAMQIYNVYLI